MRLERTNPNPVLIPENNGRKSEIKNWNSVQEYTGLNYTVSTQNII
jgi:hypothetical protein